MVVDVCTFNGEYDLWDIHYNVLQDHIDEFIVVEFDETFSEKPKEFLFNKPGPFYDAPSTWPKVRYCPVTRETWSKYLEMAQQSPNTAGAAHWKTEFAQKESIKDCLTHLNDDDVVFIGDVDEVWDKRALEIDLEQKLKLKVYTYYLNNRSSEQFWGTVCYRYSRIRDNCLNHLRTTESKTLGEYGWHFTSMGGPLSLRKKLEDSYTQESYATPEVLAKLEYNITNGKDFLGRNFTYSIDEDSWPQYLKENREKYRHLLKPSAPETAKNNDFGA